MAKLTTDVQIKDNIDQWVDLGYTDACYRRLQYTFGRPWAETSGASASGGRFPHYADIVTDMLEIGTSRRILNTQLRAAGKAMYSDVAPSFPQVPKHIGEIRKQFWLARAGGEGYGNAEWADEFWSCFMEGDGLGMGALEVGLETNPESKYQRVTLRHSPTILTIHDRTETKLSRVRGICFVKYIAPDIAADMASDWGIGRKDVKGFEESLHDGTRTKPLRFVRIFDYWDLGQGLKGTPTHAVIPGDFGNKPWLIEENVFECLPWAWYTHAYIPGKRHPMGRIEQQMATQEAINDIERRIREEIRKGSGIDILDVSNLHPQDVAKMKKGEVLPHIRTKGPIVDGNQPIIRIQSQQLQRSIVEYFQILDRQYNDDGETTDWDGGNFDNTRRTAHEAELLDQHTQSGGNHSQKEAAKMYRRAVEKVMWIAQKFDRDPVDIDVFGYNIKLSDPQDPRSALPAFLEEKSKVIVDADDLTYQDSRIKMAQRSQTLQGYVPLIQMGAMAPEWWATEMVKAGGDDPSEALIQQGQGGPQQQRQPPRITDLVEPDKLLPLLTGIEASALLQEIGITPDPARLKPGFKNPAAPVAPAKPAKPSNGKAA